MPIIKPISDLRNYNVVLDSVTEDTPVFLTKNGRGRYAVVDLSSYERLQAELKLISELAHGETSAFKGGWVSASAAKKRFGVR